MPASFSPAPNSMASLSIEEGAASRQNTSTLDTATTTVPVVMPAEKKPECDLVGGVLSGGPLLYAQASHAVWSWAEGGWHVGWRSLFLLDNIF